MGGGQGAGVLELLAEFDLVSAFHEAMEVGLYNDDGTYKAGVVQVKGGVTQAKGARSAVGT